jgi:hypothetical protein
MRTRLLIFYIGTHPSPRALVRIAHSRYRWVGAFPTIKNRLIIRKWNKQLLSYLNLAMPQRLLINQWIGWLSEWVIRLIIWIIWTYSSIIYLESGWELIVLQLYRLSEGVGRRNSQWLQAKQLELLKTVISN